MPGKSASPKETLILIGVGLITIVGVSFGIFRGFGRPIDGPATLAERFHCSELPLDLEHTQAHKLASGDRLVRLDRPLTSFLSSELPVQATAMFVEEDRGASLYFSPNGEALDADKLAAWEADSQETFKAEMARGIVTAGALEVAYIHDRIFRETGTWADSMRVNLSLEDVNCILFAEFAPGVEGTESGLTALLVGLKP